MTQVTIYTTNRSKISILKTLPFFILLSVVSSSLSGSLNDEEDMKDSVAHVMYNCTITQRSQFLQTVKHTRQDLL
jgi:hypothetical protein